MIMEKYFELLKASFDRDLTPEEHEALNKALLKHPELQAESGKLQKIRNLIAGEQYHFSPEFTQRVIHRLRSGMDRSIKNAFLRIAVPGLVAAAVLILITLLSNNPASIDTFMGIDLFKPEYLTDFIFYNN
jgi:hypothetical protein